MFLTRFGSTGGRAIWVPAFVLAFAGSAVAQGIVSELRTGVLAHDVPFLGDQKEHGVDINGELLFVSPMPVFQTAPSIQWLLRPRPDVGFDANTSGYTSQLYIGLTWTAELFHDVLSPQDGVFLSLGIGPAFNNGHVNKVNDSRKALGSNVLFHPSVEIGYRFTPRYSVSFYVGHSSNAGLAQQNGGLTNAGIRFGLAF